MTKMNGLMKGFLIFSLLCFLATITSCQNGRFSLGGMFGGNKAEKNKRKIGVLFSERVPHSLQNLIVESGRQKGLAILSIDTAMKIDGYVTTITEPEESIAQLVNFEVEAVGLVGMDRENLSKCVKYANYRRTPAFALISDKADIQGLDLAGYVLYSGNSAGEKTAEYLSKILPPESSVIVLSEDTPENVGVAKGFMMTMSRFPNLKLRGVYAVESPRQRVIFRTSPFPIGMTGLPLAGSFLQGGSIYLAQCSGEDQKSAGSPNSPPQIETVRDFRSVLEQNRDVSAVFAIGNNLSPLVYKFMDHENIRNPVLVSFGSDLFSSGKILEDGFFKANVSMDWQGLSNQFVDSINGFYQGKPVDSSRSDWIVVKDRSYYEKNKSVDFSGK